MRASPLPIVTPSCSPTRSLRRRPKVLALLGLAGLLLSVTGGCALVPIDLPEPADLAPGQPLPIDGTWRLTVNGVLMRIERGAITATQGYSAGPFRVDAGKVTTRDLRQVGPRSFAGVDVTYDVPWRAELRDDRTILITIESFLPQFYVLEPVEPADEAWLAAQLESDRMLVSRTPSAAGSGAGSTAFAPSGFAPPSAGAGELLGGAASAIGDPAAYGRYHALVIGNDAYRHLQPLRTARNDARAVADLLERAYAFEVTLLLDATREEILVALAGLRRKLAEDDNLLIYYAGHGWLDAEADEGYWLPVDAREDDNVRWIANSAITASFRALKAKHVLVVADSCYSGTLTRGIAVGTTVRNPADLDRLAQRKARIVLSSGGEEPVEDGSGDHSAFAAAFLDSLRRNRGVLDTTTLYARIRRPVMLAADQAPDLADIRKAGHDGGDFLFVRRGD